MGLIDEAIALEERAETNYRAAAETTSDPSAGKILTLLADEEAKHADALRTMNAGSLQAGSSLIDAAKDWIEQGALSDESEIRTLFHRLAAIEKGHFLFVSSLVEYYDRPAEWVESAEFGLRDEY